MQLPKDLNALTPFLKTAANYGFAGVGFFVLLYLIWFTLKDTAVDFTTVKAQNETILDKQDDTNDTLVDMKADFLHESRKQTSVLEKICINGARTKKAAEDCILQE